MILREKIKFHRKKLNLSQEELAKKCNLSRNAIYNYEKNKKNQQYQFRLQYLKL